MNENFFSQKIVNGNWDYLIILDACRYDDFKELYSRYLDGKLEKRLSRGSSTPEWLTKTFTKKYPFTYISGNPYINSYGLSLKEISDHESEWKATNHFKKIIDVWDDKWDKEKNTVLPSDIVEETKRYISKGKLIVHFMQPHKPFITEESHSSKGHARSLVKTGKATKDYSFKRKLLLKLFVPFKPLWKKFPDKARYKMKKFVGLNYGIFHDFFYEGRINELRGYYRENLEIALKHVKELVDKLPEGKIVVTADHGEAFGEHGGILQHPSKTRIPELIEVPWLEIDKGKKFQKERGKENNNEKKQRTKYTNENKEKIKKRLRYLGYFNK